jgi:hypothetical protein
MIVSMNEQGESFSSDRRSEPPPLPQRAIALPPPPLPALGAPVFAPLPALPLDYRRADMIRDQRWVPLARFPTTSQWHQARAALARGRIESRMGEGQDEAGGDALRGDYEGIELLILQSEIPRARLILDAAKNALEWCPQCGSTEVQTLPLPWWWLILSVLFLGVAPFSPPRFSCRRCTHRWE